mgnify:CR=1 FL=1
MYSLDFFFQAEDGIRDLVRSRGLGDVYKRQEEEKSCTGKRNAEKRREARRDAEEETGFLPPRLSASSPRFSASLSSLLFS